MLNDHIKTGLIILLALLTLNNDKHFGKPQLPINKNL